MIGYRSKQQHGMTPFTKTVNGGALSSLLNHLHHSHLLHSLPPPPPPPSLPSLDHRRRNYFHLPLRVHHSFKYSVSYAFIDLDCTPHPPPHHLSPQQARDIAQTNGPVFLLTIPPSVGYEQNPLSLYYCYNKQGSITTLNKCIAEVTNTPWGERVQFLFNPNSDVVAKPLHVSPFMDMLGSWSIRTSTPGDNLVVNISVKHSKLGDYFTASLTANRVPSSSVEHAVFFWLMPHKVAVWFYWHALKLWWKNVVFIQHPRYGNSSYKEDAMARDRSLACCQAFAMQRIESDFERTKTIVGLDGQMLNGPGAELIKSLM